MSLGHPAKWTRGEPRTVGDEYLCCIHWAIRNVFFRHVGCQSRNLLSIHSVIAQVLGQRTEVNEHEELFFSCHSLVAQTVSGSVRHPLRKVKSFCVRN